MDNLEQFQKNEFGIQKKNYQDQRNSNRKYNINNCKIISFYAEKGGVCKTTNTINLAYAFAANGKRVLIYDCDSQRSSTAALLGLRLLNDQYIDERSPLTSLINRPINQGYHRTLYDQVMDNERNVKPCEAIPIANNIWLVPGNRETNILETTIALEESYSRNKTPFHLNQKTGKPYASIIETAKDYKIDYVFLDLNPNKGVLNRCLIFSSHYIIVPAVVPVPFLEERHMIEYDHVNDIVRNMPPQNREKFMEKTLKFRQVFQEIYNTIVMIIHLDNNNESATL